MLRLSYLAAFVGLGLAACGLIDSSVTDFKLRFPRHDFQIDSADWRFADGASVPVVPCSACGSAPEPICAGSCGVECEASSQTCQARVTVLLRNDFDLAAQAPEFQQIADQPFLSVTIDDVYFDISQNSLNVATPELQVWFGPAAATGPGDAGVQLVGTIASVGAEQVGRRPLQFEGSGQQILKSFMDDFHTPFRVFVVGEILVRGGDETPDGRLVGSVQAEAHVGLD
jgi:hypothetical protein